MPPAWRARYYAAEADRIDLAEIGDAHIISVFIYSDLDASVLSQLPSLQMIATRSTGVDHIDMAYCRERNIVVSNVPSYGANTVAEHTFALLLSLSRNIYQARERTLRNDFSLQGLQGFDLMGKVLGGSGTGCARRGRGRSRETRTPVRSFRRGEVAGGAAQPCPRQT